MTKRTFKRIQMLHEEGTGLKQSITIIISLSDSNDEAAENIIALIRHHLLNPPKIMYHTDGKINLRELSYLISGKSREENKNDPNH